MFHKLYKHFNLVHFQFTVSIRALRCSGIIIVIIIKSWFPKISSFFFLCL